MLLGSAWKVVNNKTKDILLGRNWDWDFPLNLLYKKVETSASGSFERMGTISDSKVFIKADISSKSSEMAISSKVISCNEELTISAFALQEISNTKVPALTQVIIIFLD